MHTTNRLAALVAFAGTLIAPGTALASPDAMSEDGSLTQAQQHSDAVRNPIDFQPASDLLGPAATSTFVFGGSDPEGDNASDVKFTPDGSQFVIAHIESRNLIIWDADTRDFVRAIDLPGRPVSFDITPDGTTAVVALLDTDEVAIADLTTGAVTNVISVGQNPGVVRILPAGDLAGVGITGDGELAVIDISAGTVVRTIASIGFSQTFSFAPETGAASITYSEFEVIDADRVANISTFDNELQLVDLRTGAVNRIPVTDNASGISVAGDGSRIAITHRFATRQITLVNPATGFITGIIPTTVDLSGPIVLNGDGSLGVAAIQNAARTFDANAGTFGAASINTASVSELHRTADGNRAVGIGFFGSVIDFATGNLLANANNQVSIAHGAASPVDDLVVGCSTTFGDDFVVIDADATPTLEAFQLTGPPPEGDRLRTVAISDDGATAAGVSIFSDTLTVIDTATATATGWAPLGQRPSGVAITSDGTRAVVANLDSTFASVVDLATATSTEIPISRRASRVEIAPDDSYAYLAVVADGDGVWRIDLNTNTVAGSKILTGNMGGVGYAYSQNSDLKLSPDGSVLAVAGSFTNDVSLIDTASWSLLGNAPAGAFPTYLAFTPDGATVAASNRNNDTVTLIDVGTQAITGTVVVGDFPGQLEATDDGRMFVVNFSDDTVGQIDLGTTAQTAVIPVGETIAGIRVDNSARRLYVAAGTATTTIGGAVGFAQSEEGRLRVYDLDTLALLDTIELGVGPTDFALDDAGQTAAIAAIQADGVAVVSLADCPADLNGDELFNNTDINLFVSAFLASDAAADLNADGLYNNTDINLFVSLFLSQCN